MQFEKNDKFPPTSSNGRSQLPNFEELQQLLPIFDPHSALSLNSVEWVEEVENVAVLNNWKESFTLSCASLRLESDAKLWFQMSMRHCNNWNEFKYEFIRIFPSSKHPSQFIKELFQRSKKDSECFEYYVYDVAKIAGKCNLDIQTTISYIISGLPDVRMRNRLIAYNCKSLTELLSRIQTINYNLEQQAKWNDPDGAKTKDHDLQKLPPVNKRRLNEPSQTPAPKKYELGRAGNVNCEWKELIRTVKVNNVYLEAFIDLASKYTTLQSSVFKKNSWKLQHTDVVLGGMTKVLGMTCQEVTIDQVKMLIEIMIVDDSQGLPMVLGRNFLQNPNVSVVTRFGSIQVNFVEAASSMAKPIPNPNPESKKKKLSKSVRRMLRRQEEQLKAEQAKKNVQNEVQTKVDKKEIEIKEEVKDLADNRPSIKSGNKQFDQSQQDLRCKVNKQLLDGIKKEDKLKSFKRQDDYKINNNNNDTINNNENVPVDPRIILQLLNNIGVEFLD